MSVTYVATQNQAVHHKRPLVSEPKYRKNSKTKKSYRVDDSDLIPKRKRYRLPPRFHRDSLFDWIARQREAAAQLNTPDSKAAQIVRHYGTRGLVLYTLSAKELGVTNRERIAWLEAPENYDDPATIEAWGRLIAAAFPDMPYKWASHCGRENRVAPHVIAGVEHDIPNPSRDPERIKPVGAGFKDRRRTFAYLCSKMSATHRQVQAFDRAVAAAGSVRNLPQHSGFANMGAVRSVENDVLHDKLEKVPKVIGTHENTPPMTFPALESWLGSTFGSFDKAVFPPRKSLYPSLMGPGDAVT